MGLIMLLSIITVSQQKGDHMAQLHTTDDARVIVLLAEVESLTRFDVNLRSTYEEPYCANPSALAFLWEMGIIFWLELLLLLERLRFGDCPWRTSEDQTRKATPKDRGVLFHLRDAGLWSLWLVINWPSMWVWSVEHGNFLSTLTLTPLKLSKLLHTSRTSKCKYQEFLPHGRDCAFTHAWWWEQFFLLQVDKMCTSLFYIDLFLRMVIISSCMAHAQPVCTKNRKAQHDM